MSGQVSRGSAGEYQADERVLDQLLTEILSGQNGIKSKFKILEISSNSFHGTNIKASV